MNEIVTPDQQMQSDNPNAPNYDWQADREWFNQRLANARIYNGVLERRLAALRATLRDIASGSPGHRSLARTALDKDDEASVRNSGSGS